MWLKSLEQEREKDEGLVLNMQGYALSKSLVADFIKRLEHSPELGYIQSSKRRCGRPARGSGSL